MTVSNENCQLRAIRGVPGDSVMHSTLLHSRDPHHAGRMVQTPPEILVQPDAFRVTREPLLLVSELQAALAVCLFDDTQAVGGLLHLRYVAINGTEPVDLTDNTLSSDLLLMDRFCKELRSAGARKQSWRVSIFGHTPQQPAMEGPAATVIDLAKAYFSDARLPVECKEFRRPLGVVVRMDAREGRIWVNGTPGTAAAV
jgi:chemotaxis receptor (MCP) glutamine deamidase CheD